MGRFMYTGPVPKEYWANQDPSKRFQNQKDADEYAAQLAIQKHRQPSRHTPSLDTASLGKIGDGRMPIRDLAAPGTPIGQTDAGKAAFGYEEEQEKARQQEEMNELKKRGLQEFADKHGTEVSKDMINLLANIGALDEGLKQVIELNAARQEEEEARREQEFETSERIASQEFKIGEREAEQGFEASERKAEYGQDVAIEKLKQEGEIAKAMTPKPLERKSTTTSAKMISDLGFGLTKFKTLREKVVSGDVDIFKTTLLGEFIDPELKDAIYQLGELHGREQSGAAISKSEWRNFEKQILNKKFLLTDEGRKAALKNIDEFIGRYFAKGEAVSQDPGWFGRYTESAGRGVEAVGGSHLEIPNEVLRQAQEALNDPDAPEEVKAKARQLLGQ